MVLRRKEKLKEKYMNINQARQIQEKTKKKMVKKGTTFILVWLSYDCCTTKLKRSVSNLIYPPYNAILYYIYIIYIMGFLPQNIDSLFFGHI